MIVFTDLDGTLINKGSRISEENRNTINELREKRIKVVLATGRNLFSLNRIQLDQNLFDYIIFSTGYGIRIPADGRIIKSGNLDKGQIVRTISLLDSLDLDYMIMKSGPENHKFHYPRKNHDNADFSRRLENYKQCTVPMKEILNCASQFLVIFNDPDFRISEQIKVQLEGMSVIYTLSPFDRVTCWLEIFNNDVSKKQAAEKICEIENIKASNCVTVGNDYNDIDLMNYTGHSFIVKNSPEVLRKRFRNVKESYNNGFSEAVQLWRNERGLKKKFAFKLK